MNAYITSFVFCDTIQEQMTPKGPQYQIVSPLQELLPISIPGNYSFAIACSISGFELDKDHFVSIILNAPDGKECAKPVDNVKFIINSAEKTKGKISSPSISLNIDLRNMALYQEGIYTAIVMLDNISIGEYKIRATMQGRGV